MPHSSSYSIETQGNIIRVKLKGKWSLAQDMAYLTQLSQAIDGVKSQPWGLLVDMREWQLEQGQAQSPTRRSVANVEMDRRNQKAECWLVNDSFQANSLEQFIPNELPFLRASQLQQARLWFKQYSLHLLAD